MCERKRRYFWRIFVNSGKFFILQLLLVHRHYSVNLLINHWGSVRVLYILNRPFGPAWVLLCLGQLAIVPGWIWGCISERSSAQNSDSNKIWRTFLAQIDRKYWFGAAIWRRMIPKIHLAQQFGKDLVKQLSIYVLVYLKLWFEKNEKPISKIRWKFRIFPKTAYFFATIFLAQVLAQLYMNSKNLWRRKIERFILAIVLNFRIPGHLKSNFLTCGYMAMWLYGYLHDYVATWPHWTINKLFIVQCLTHRSHTHPFSNFQHCLNWTIGKPVLTLKKIPVVPVSYRENKFFLNIFFHGFKLNVFFQPAISIGNVGQLAIDLLIYNLDLKQVGYLYDCSILPLVGNDPFTSPKIQQGNLVTSAEGTRLSIICLSHALIQHAWLNHYTVMLYIYTRQWRSQPDNLVPLCKFRIIIIIHFFRN